MNWMKQLQRRFRSQTARRSSSRRFNLIERNRIRLGKLLLLAAIGLTMLVVLELRQEMVKAIELTAIEQPAIERPSPQLRLPEAPSSTAAPTTTAEGEPIAISTDLNATQPQQIAQINPSQIAANQWAGSSFPVESFQAYTSPFGYRRSATGGYGREFHYGLDLAAPMGSYIRNWWAGTVVEVSDNSNCGTSVVIESGHWLHIYCHMQGHVETVNGQPTMIDRSGGVQIVQNQQVAAGTPIGRVGMTGRTTGPHLHWGLKYDGNWVNPALVLRAMYAGQRETATNPQ